MICIPWPTAIRAAAKLMGEDGRIITSGSRAKKRTDSGGKYGRHRQRFANGSLTMKGVRKPPARVRD
jgi:hypothetical protein